MSFWFELCRCVLGIPRFWFRSLEDAFPLEGGSPFHYWRTVSGHEVDLVIELSPGSLMAVEAKWKEQPDMSDTSGVRALVCAEGARKVESFIVAGTTVDFRLTDGTWVTDVKGLLATLSGRLGVRS